MTPSRQEISTRYVGSDRDPTGRRHPRRPPAQGGSERGSLDSPDSGPWLAAYTRPRHEDKLRRYCQERDIEAFLPTYQSRRCWSDRAKVLELPLFPSYVFLRPTSPPDRERVVRAPGFLWFVHNSSGPVYASDVEVSTIRRLLASGLAFDPLPNIRLGDAVEIVSGVMRGCRGHLLRKDTTSVVLTVSAVNGTVRVVLPDGSSVRRLAMDHSSKQRSRRPDVLIAVS